MKKLIAVFAVVLLSHAFAFSQIRVATFNTSLNHCRDQRTNPCLDGGLNQLFADPAFREGQQVAELLQRIRPGIILLNEFNFDPTGDSIELFQQNFLAVGQNYSRHPDGPALPISYPYRFAAPSNTGIHSGQDFNHDGRVDQSPGDGAYANDAFGFGEFEGRYGMLLLSQFPIDTENARTFQNFLWKDMPNAHLPDNSATPEAGDWYAQEELDVFRLSSKSHWDIPIEVGDKKIHLLASHPTPPVFDGPEDRNGRRNHDEIRFWADYVSPESSSYVVDDEGQRNGLGENATFIIVGDLNADPHRGDSFDGAINQLLDHPRVNTQLTPLTESGSDITSDFNLRVDYVLPSNDISMLQANIFSPAIRDPLRRLQSVSDHRLVWVDIRAVPEPSSMSMLVGLAALAPFWKRRVRPGRFKRCIKT